MIGGVTLEGPKGGRLFTQVQKRAFTSAEVIVFLKHLLWLIKGKVIVVWDGASIHRSQEVRDYLADGADKRLHLVRLPAYSPELNPAEGVWNLMKHSDLKNVCCRDLVQLQGLLKSAALRLANRPDLLHACIQQPGCYA